MPPAPHIRHVALPSLKSPTTVAAACGGSRKLSSKHTRQRSSSSSSNGSQLNGSRALPPFPILAGPSEGVLEANASEILWKTFVAYEQDCREAPNLLPLVTGIEATVAAAVDPISFAGEALAQCASYMHGEVRQNIELALGANAGSSAMSRDPPKTTNTASHSKQLSLASTRLSSACSAFRATQTSLRYYGGARKTAYQLDLFIHKYALPTSTSLHKRAQEFSAASKWLKKVLGNEARAMETFEMASLRKASTAITKWADALAAHAEMMKKAANDVRALMAERVKLHSYTFPHRTSPEMTHTVPSPRGLQQSPLPTFVDLSPYIASETYSQSPAQTNINLTPSPSNINLTSSPVPSYASASRQDSVPRQHQAQNVQAQPQQTQHQQQSNYLFYDSSALMPMADILTNGASSTGQAIATGYSLAPSAPQQLFPQTCAFTYTSSYFTPDQIIQSQPFPQATVPNGGLVYQQGVPGAVGLDFNIPGELLYGNGNVCM